MNNILEGVRQVRGTAANQVAGAEHVLVDRRPQRRPPRRRLSPMSYRVIQFSTGNVGATRCGRSSSAPTSSWSGCTPRSPTKVGRDAAELCGLDTPTGVIATDDVDALVALGADCVVYTSQAETRPHEALAELTALPRRRHRTCGHVARLAGVPAPRRRLAAGAARGGVPRRAARRMYVNGIDPGFSGDLLPARRPQPHRAGPTRVHVQEICDYGSYDDAEFTGASFGFGSPPDQLPMLFLPGVVASIWGGPVRLLADELGVELDEIRERHETWMAAEPIDCTMMHVEPGTVAGGALRRRGDRRRRAPHRDGAREPAHLGRRAGLARTRPTASPACTGWSSPATPASRSTPTSGSTASTTTRPA